MRTDLMTRSTRPVLAVLGALALAGGLSSCGGQAAGQSADALTEVSFVYDGALTVCSDIPYEPFEFKKNGQFTGFDVDLVNEIAKDFDVQLDMVDVAFDDITSGKVLNEEVCDLAVSAMTITGERARVLDFSSPYFDAKQVMVTTKGSGLADLASLAGRKVGVQGETTGETYVRDFAPDTAQVVPYEDAALLEQALLDGSVDAIVLDNTISGPMTEKNPRLRVAREFDTGEQYGMAVRKDGNIPLLRRINDALTELRADGTYEKIYNTYF
jgi:polar amino acid transport system substrate-binding protein